MNESRYSPVKAKVVIVEDHPIFREQLVHMITRELHLVVVGHTDNIRDAMKIIEDQKPDLVIVDLSLNGASGLELIKDLRAQHNEIPALVLSMHAEHLYAERVLRAGGNGYVTKNDGPAEVRAAIQKVLQGEVYASPATTTRLLQRLSDTYRGSLPVGIASLADRELEVFSLLGSGLNSREIADRLGLGETTINSYRFRIRRKLGLKNAAELYSCAATWLSDQPNQQATA